MKMIWAPGGVNGRDPCAVCGKELSKTGQRYCVHVINGGSDVLHPADEHLYVEDAGEMGFHSVGSECRKRFGEFAVKE